MAKDGFALQSTSFTFIKTALEFETSVKDRINWTKKQWSQSDEGGKRVNKLVNSMKYWSKKLKPAMVDSSIIITLFNYDQDVKMDLSEIITHIEGVDDNIKVRGFSDFRNPRYLCFYFADKKERDSIIEKLRIIGNNYVVYLQWAAEATNNVITMKVHWLPRTFELNDIKKALLKYVKCIEEERISLTLMSGRNMPSGKVTFRATVNDDITVESIPHLVNILDMEALVTITGRSPLCLNCEVLGHVSKNCKLRYCSVCTSLQLKEHACSSELAKPLYATIVKENADEVARIDPDDWGSAFNTEDISHQMKQKNQISEKISDIEQQIIKVNNEIINDNVSKQFLKRKADEKVSGTSWSEYDVSDQAELSSENEEEMFSGDSQTDSFANNKDLTDDRLPESGQNLQRDAEWIVAEKIKKGKKQGTVNIRKKK